MNRWTPSCCCGNKDPNEVLIIQSHRSAGFIIGGHGADELYLTRLNTNNGDIIWTVQADNNYDDDTINDPFNGSRYPVSFGTGLALSNKNQIVCGTGAMFYLDGEFNKYIVTSNKPLNYPATDYPSNKRKLRYKDFCFDKYSRLYFIYNAAMFFGSPETTLDYAYRLDRTCEKQDLFFRDASYIPQTLGITYLSAVSRSAPLNVALTYPPNNIALINPNDPEEGLYLPYTIDKKPSRSDGQIEPTVTVREFLRNCHNGWSIPDDITNVDLESGEMTVTGSGNYWINDPTTNFSLSRIHGGEVGDIITVYIGLSPLPNSSFSIQISTYISTTYTGYRLDGSGQLSPVLVRQGGKAVFKKIDDSRWQLINYARHMGEHQVAYTQTARGLIPTFPYNGYLGIDFLKADNLGRAVVIQRLGLTPRTVLTSYDSGGGGQIFEFDPAVVPEILGSTPKVFSIIPNDGYYLLVILSGEHSNNDPTSSGYIVRLSAASEIVWKKPFFSQYSNGTYQGLGDQVLCTHSSGDLIVSQRKEGENVNVLQRLKLEDGDVVWETEITGLVNNIQFKIKDNYDERIGVTDIVRPSEGLSYET